MRNLVAFAAGSALALSSAVALAQAGTAQVPADPSAVSQPVGHGQINWTNKTITATGSGAPDLKAANVAVARLGAERAAKMDALRNIIEAVKGVRVSGGSSAANTMDTSPEIKAKVEGAVRNFKVLDTKYYSDGGVDVIVQVPLDGVLLETLVPQAGAKAQASGADSSGTTGVIVNAKGLKVIPALAPRLVDDKGGELYGAQLVNKDALRAGGVASYVKSLDQATKDGRVAGKPLVIKAAKLADGSNGSDVVIGAEDAAKLAGLKSLLAQGKVIIVTD
jgi:hypothetical protein